MRARIGERRRSDRAAACGTAILRDSVGNFITRCRVTNVSGQGVFLMLSEPPDLPLGCEAVVELALRGEPQARPRLRTTVHTCRVVRIQHMGGLTGVGLELVKKLS
jgi:hypothetical protein